MRSSLGARVATYAGAVVVGLFAIFPLYWMVLTSLKQDDEVTTATPDFWPNAPQWHRYVDVLVDRGIGRALLHSLFAATLSTLIGIVLAAMAGYALARMRVPGRRAILFVLMAAQMLPVVVTLIPLFIELRDAHLLNSLVGLALVYVGFNVPLSIWLMREYLAAIPYEMEEAALIDGASRVQAMVRVILPLALPGLAATSLLAFIASWSEFLFALTFITDGARSTLPVAIVQTFTGRNGPDDTGIMVASTLYTLPVIVVFLLLRRNLTKGVAVGAVKG